MLLIISMLIIITIWNHITNKTDCALHDIKNYNKLNMLTDTLKTNIHKIQKESMDVFNKKTEHIIKRENGIWKGQKAKKFAETIKNKNIYTWITGWSGDHNWLNYPIIYDYNFLPNVKNIMPNLCKYLDNIKSEIFVCGLSVMAPYSKIKEHVDSNVTFSKGSLVYHFNILCPDISHDTNESIITINNKKIIQETGNALLFDSEYPHSVNNNSNMYRIILYMDFRI
jgi:hypothetical protein